MAVSKVSISNMALSRLGAKSRIESLLEESTAAQSANLWYDIALKETLEAHHWGFATTTAALATHADAPPSDWLYRYQYPASAVDIHELLNPLGKRTDPVPYAIELSNDANTKTIVTDLPEACARYTRLIDNPGLYSAHFIKALTLLLAHYMAYSITGKLSLEDKMLNQWREALLTAPAHDSNESQSPQERDAKWVRARN